MFDWEKIFTVDFDQDLYVPDITSPCREQKEECKNDTFGECGKGCDYTHTGCEVLASNPDMCCPDYEKYPFFKYILAENCGKLNISQMSIFLFECSRFCLNSESWIDIKNGTATPSFLANAESIYYRYEGLWERDEKRK